MTILVKADWIEWPGRPTARCRHLTGYAMTRRLRRVPKERTCFRQSTSSHNDDGRSRLASDS